MLYLGIPEYRLPRDVIQAQVREILDLGPELRLNSRLGDFSLADLRAEGFSAILLAFGLHRSRDLQIPGHDLDGVIKGVDFLLNVNLGYRFSIGKKVVVIGGGNVAIDVARSALRQQQQQTIEALRASLLPDRLSESELQIAMKEFLDVTRTALRLGAHEVHLVALESLEEMPAFEDEIEEALREGLKVHPSLGPKRFVGEDGKVVGLETIRCTSVFDAQHRFSPTFEQGTESVLSCDTVILAIGQASDLSFLTPSDGVETMRQGTIKVDPETRAVISHKIPEKPPAIEDLAAAVTRLKGEAGRRDEVFRKQVESEKSHGKVLEKKFDELLRQARENPDLTPPKRDIDLD